MPFDGTVVSAVVQELNEKLINGRIEKIYQPEADEINILIRSNNNSYKLLVSADSKYARIHLTNYNKQNPQTPPMFCMLMRKHLQGGRIIGISQKEFDRIVIIEIESYDELGDLTVKQLVIEIMGRHSSIILLDKQSNKIIDSIKRIPGDINRHREILPGKIYIAPPQQDKINPLDLSYNTFLLRVKDYPNGTSVYKSIYSTFQGISPLAAKEICHRAGIDSDTAITRLSGEDITALWNALNNMLEIVKANDYIPMIIQSKDSTDVIDFYAIELYSYSKIYEPIKYNSISEVIEKYYFKKDFQERIKQKSLDLKKLTVHTQDKLANKKQKLLDELKNAAKSHEFRIMGELLTANIHKIEAGMKEILVENYYDENYSPSVIPLDPRISPSKNAQRYFKKYTKAKNALVEIQNQLEEVEKEIHYFENIIQSIDNAAVIDDIEEIRLELITEGYIHRKKAALSNSKKSVKKPLSFISTDGFEIYVGKNNTQNDTLTLKTASKADLWFHAKEIAGSHVILITKNIVPPEASVIEAAELAAFFSKARLSSNVPVDYTLVKNVKKPKGAKPGMVIYENYKTIYVTPPMDVENLLVTK